MAKRDSSSRASRNKAKPTRPEGVPAHWLRPSEIPRHWADLLRQIPGYDSIKTAGDSWFDPEAAQQALDFFPECLHHVEGDLAGRPFELEPWQKSVVANLFGWKRFDELGRAVRRYKETLLYVPRKNGKTPLTAGIGLLILFCDDEVGQQDYLAAADREQAGTLFRHAKGMVGQEPELQNRCRIFGGRAEAGQSKSIVLDEDGSFLRVISADADTKHGGNSHLVIVEELHAQPDRELIDVLTTSTASLNRKQTTIIYVTTADYSRPSICNEKHDYASKVQGGVIDDPSFLPVIYEAKPTDDWTDEKVWAKANPNLGVSVSLDYLRRECKKAQENPALENTFKRLHLNMKTETDVRAIDMKAWARCGEVPLNVGEFEGKECYAGWDGASTTDIAAFVMAFPLDGGFALVPRFWVPRENARQRSKRDRVPYETWARVGLMTLTEGNVIDYDRVRADINELGQSFQIKEIACDRWNSTQLMTQLAGDGFEVVAYGQGFKDMTAPTKHLLALITAGKLVHGANPVLRWMASNLATESDAADNLKPSKKKSTEKIDGLVAAIMAIGRAMLVDSDGEGPAASVLTLSDPDDPFN